MLQQLFAIGAGIMLLAGVGLWENGKLLPPWEADKRLAKMTETAITKARASGVPIPAGDRARISLGSFNTDKGRAYVPPPNAGVRTCRYPAGDESTPPTVCDTEKCVFAEGQTCFNSTRLCYDTDGALILNLKGEPATDSQYYPYDWKESWNGQCLAEDGSVLPPPGERPYEERYAPGCSYRVVHPKWKSWETDILITCDEYRCVFPGSGTEWRFATKQYYQGFGKEKKTVPRPGFGEFASLNWTCLSPAQAKKYEANYPYDNIPEDDIPSGCRMRYQNDKHVYEHCIFTYNELGERTGRRLQSTEEYLREFWRFKTIIGEILDSKYFTSQRKRMGVIEMKLYERTPAADEKKLTSALKTFSDTAEPFPRWPAKVSKALNALEREIKEILKK